MPMDDHDLAPWPESTHCRSGRHCRKCRDLAGGRKWRAEIMAHWAVPGGIVDWVCPAGLALGHSQGPPATPTPPQSEELAALSQLRWAVCRECEHSCEGGYKCAKHTGCCFGKWRAKSESQCPDDPPRWLGVHLTTVTVMAPSAWST